MATISVNQALILLLCFISFAITAHSYKLTTTGLKDDSEYCVYTLYIRTGTIWKGGTDSVIGLGLGGPEGWGIYIDDLESWGGLMGAGYNYYERGNLDVFSGIGPCLPSWPPCWLNLTSDGSGDHHGWYCNYVEVTSTGPHKGCAQQQFNIEQWLARDAKPYQLYAERDLCPAAAAGEDEGRRNYHRKSLVGSEGGGVVGVM